MKKLIPFDLELAKQGKQVVCKTETGDIFLVEKEDIYLSIEIREYCIWATYTFQGDKYERYFKVDGDGFSGSKLFIEVDEPEYWIGVFKAKDLSNKKNVSFVPGGTIHSSKEDAEYHCKKYNGYSHVVKINKPD